MGVRLIQVSLYYLETLVLQGFFSSAIVTFQVSHPYKSTGLTSEEMYNKHVLNYFSSLRGTAVTPVSRVPQEDKVRR